MSRIAEALRGLLAEHNPKAFATAEQQQAAIEAQAALEEWDRERAPDAAPAPAPAVADQRAAFLEAMHWGTP